jgi:hypothetical protein
VSVLAKTYMLTAFLNAKIASFSQPCKYWVVCINKIIFNQLFMKAVKMQNCNSFLLFVCCMYVTSYFAYCYQCHSRSVNFFLVLMASMHLLERSLSDAETRERSLQKLKLTLHKVFMYGQVRHHLNLSLDLVCI